MTNSETIYMPVSGKSNSKRLAGAVRERYREDPDALVELGAIGMSAVNNAVKAVVELNKLLAGKGVLVLMHPLLEDKDIVDRGGRGNEGVQRTVTVFRLKTQRI